MADLTALFEQHRGELRVHCYRMLGSFDEADDLVQETFLRAWKNLAGFEGRSTPRAWLYRIATNACPDFLDGRARRALPYQVTDLTDFRDGAWLQPFPDDLVPDEAVVARETLELTFLASIQLLPPPSRRLEWTTGSGPSASELAVLRRYMAVVEGGDLTGVAALLAERFRLLPVRANLQPAMAAYTDGKAFAISVLRIEDGRIAELTAFHDPALFEAFGLPMTFPDGDRLKGTRSSGGAS